MSVVQHAAHGGDGAAFGRSCVPATAGAAMDAGRAQTSALLPSAWEARSMSGVLE